MSDDILDSIPLEYDGQSFVITEETMDKAIKVLEFAGDFMSVGKMEDLILRLHRALGKQGVAMSEPRHGTEIRYVKYNCPCKKCQAFNPHERENRKFVPAEETYNHLKEIWEKTNLSQTQISEITGVSQHSISAILRMAHKNVTKRTRDAILSIDPNDYRRGVYVGSE